MRAHWLLISFVLSCGSTEPSDRCPTAASQPLPACTPTVNEGLSCDIPPPSDSIGHRPTNCNCQGGFWVCNNCPSVYSPPNGGTCTPGDTCSWNSWEHGCDCGCSAAGQWGCSPVTIGTTECGHDAGV